MRLSAVTNTTKFRRLASLTHGETVTALHTMASIKHYHGRASCPRVEPHSVQLLHITEFGQNVTVYVYMSIKQCVPQPCLLVKCLQNLLAKPVICSGALALLYLTMYNKTVLIECEPMAYCCHQYRHLASIAVDNKARL